MPPGTSCRTIHGFLDHTAVAYDLPAPGVRATLYVVNCAVDESVDNQPSPHPYNTGTLWASAWQDQGHLYVLVVQGTKADYLNLIKPPAGAV